MAERTFIPREPSIPWGPQQVTVSAEEFEGLEQSMANAIAGAPNMSLRSWLMDQGATKTMIQSKVVDLLEQGMTELEISRSESARERIEAMEEKLANIEEAESRLRSKYHQADDRQRKLGKDLEQYEAARRDVIIEDRVVVDGVNAFETMLQAVRDIFGEDKMTEAVICAAVNSAGYGYWRTVGNAEQRKHPSNH